jgi:type IV secretory pathway VirB4 component
MTAISRRSEAFARGARMLRTALGPAISGHLKDPSIVEVMLNRDGRLWVDRLSGGLEDTGVRVAPADAERILRLVAHHVGVEVHPGSPRVSAELPETGERFEGLVPPVVAAPCFAIRRQRVRVPETPMYLDAVLVDEDLTGGLEPRLGGAHLRTLTVMGFPSQTWPGLLDDLNRLAFPYRWATRAICLDKMDATKVLGRIRRQWFAKRKSIMAILKEVMTNAASVLMDSDAANKALDADAAPQELGSDLVGEAYVTATVTVWDEDARTADERLRLVEKAIQGRDFTCMRETVNAIEAWLGSLPGHIYANVRQPPISTMNLAHMMPFSAVWAGPERDEHFQAPPLFFARTEGSTPFRFSLHVGDVGHTLIVGPTGAGKSVLLALMALQFRRYL